MPHTGSRAGRGDRAEGSIGAVKHWFYSRRVQAVVPRVVRPARVVSVAASVSLVLELYDSGAHVWGSVRKVGPWSLGRSKENWFARHFTKVAVCYRVIV